MRNRRALVALAAVALLPTGCGAGSAADGNQGPATLVVATDLPLQGPAKDASDATNDAIELYLEQIGHTVGDFSIALRRYDDSTAAKGTWDEVQCAANARAHVAEADEVAVMGTGNSGCAKIETTVLNQDPTGPMLMVSHANTNPGLTKKWGPGEPEKYFPTGQRNYARVITTDDYQGSAAAAFLAEQGLETVFVLNDGQTYGQGLATSFVTGAEKVGLTVLGNEAWDAHQAGYRSLFAPIKASRPDAIYLAGLFDNNGAQLVRDKVAVLGDNMAVRLMAPDGFTGYPELRALPEAEGMYLTFTGLTVDRLQAAGGMAARLLSAYKDRFGRDLTSSFALYGVCAVQVILAAIERSDGTRKGVRDAVFEGEGITIPAAQSLTGKAVRIDPATGDITSQDISVLELTGGRETFLKAQPVA
jgi:branched-chain amino acid transport system substrate-binding protein